VASEEHGPVDGVAHPVTRAALVGRIRLLTGVAYDVVTGWPAFYAVIASFAYALDWALDGDDVAATEALHFGDNA
jgi:hypothetical protein